MVRHAQRQPEQADDGADQPLGLAVGQAEHGPERERRQDGERRVPGLPAPGRAWFRRPGFDRLVGEPDRQAAALPQAGVIRRPVRDLVRLSRDAVAAVLVQLEGQGGHPGSAREHSPTAPGTLQPEDRSVHHADQRHRLERRLAAREVAETLAIPALDGLRPSFWAYCAVATVRAFTHGAAREIDAGHLPPLPRGPDRAEAVLAWAHRLWAEMRDPTSAVPAGPD